MAKTKPEAQAPSLKSLSEEELLKLLQSGDASDKTKVIESLTDDLLKQLVDEFKVPARDSEKKEEEKDGSGSKDSSQHDVLYIDQLHSEKEERKEWIELRQRHLIENDLIRIDQYVNEIVDALLQFEIDLTSDEDEDILLTESEREQRRKKQLENYHIQFLKQLTQPIQKSSTDIL